MYLLLFEYEKFFNTNISNTGIIKNDQLYSSKGINRVIVGKV